MQEYADYHVFLKTCGLNQKNRKYAEDYIALKEVPKQHVKPGSLKTKSIFVNYIVEEFKDYPVFGKFVHKNVFMAHTIYLEHSNEKKIIYYNFVKTLKHLKKAKEIKTKFAIIGIIEPNKLMLDIIHFLEENNVEIIYRFCDTFKFMITKTNKDYILFYNTKIEYKYKNQLTDANYTTILYKPIKFLHKLNYKNGELHGNCIEYYENGELRSCHNFDNGKLHGNCKEYSTDGEIEFDRNYNNSQLHGNCIIYYINGCKKINYNYYNGNKHGKCEDYHTNGELRNSRYYIIGKRQ